MVKPDLLWTAPGVPEGCALSCYAMGIVDLSLHFYLKHFSPPQFRCLLWTTWARSVRRSPNCREDNDIILEEFLHLDTEVVDLVYKF